MSSFPKSFGYHNFFNVPFPLSQRVGERIDSEVGVLNLFQVTRYELFRCNQLKFYFMIIMVLKVQYSSVNEIETIDSTFLPREEDKFKLQVVSFLPDVRG